MNKAVFSALTLLLIFLGVASIWETDIWFHLKTGEWILAHHAIPTRDIFSYTAAGHPWIAESWLSQVVFFLVYHLSGVPGLILFKAAVIVAAFMLLYVVLMRRGIDATVAAMVVFLAAVLSRERFVERPHIFSFLFLSVYLYILNLSDRRWRWLIVPLQILWANMHGENVLGILLCVVYVGCEMSQDSSPFGLRMTGDNWLRMTSNKLIFLLAVIAVTFMNPFTWRSPFYGLITFNSGELMKYVIEFRPTPFTSVYRPFWLYAAAAVMLTVFDRRRRLSEVLAGVIFLILAMRVTRFIPEFLIVSAPAVASGLSYLLENMMEGRLRPTWLIFVIMTFITIQVVDKQIPQMRPGLGVNKDALPVRAADFISRNHLHGRMYNTMAYGGYLLWKLYPQVKVFIDGRTDVYGPQFIDHTLKSNWQQLKDQYHFDFAVIDNIDIYRGYPARELDEDNNWALVYFDDVNLVYVRKDGADAAVAHGRAYHLLKPNAPDLSYLDAIPDRKALKSELLRAIGEAPSLTADQMLARVEEKDGDFEGALKVLEDAAHDYPRVAGVRELLRELKVGTDTTFHE
jgi:hypothetical protein